MHFPPKLICLLSLLSLVPIVVRGEIPLVLEETVALPSDSGLWDVQYWMDDSTLGWAYMPPHGNVCTYAARTSDAVTSVPLAFHHVSADTAFLENKLLTLTRSPSAPGHAAIATYVRFDMIAAWTNIFDLTTGDTLIARGGWVTPDEEVMLSLIVNPSPPGLLQELIYTSWLGFWGDNIYYRYSESVTYEVSNNGWEYLGGSDMGRVDRFRYPTDEPRFCGIGFSARYNWESGWADRGVHIAWLDSNAITIGTFNLGDPDTNWQAQTERRVTAQQNSDGARRVITDRGECFGIPDTNLLWSNPDVNGIVLTAIVDNNPNELVLVFDPEAEKCHVFHPNTGNLMDSTTVFFGIPQYVIKSPDNIDKIVTKDGEMLFIYAPDLQSRPPSLTIRAVASTSGDPVIRLSWHYLARSIAYRVYSSAFPGDPESLIAIVPAESTAVTLPVDQDRAFFRVVAEYNE